MSIGSWKTNWEEVQYYAILLGVVLLLPVVLFAGVILLKKDRSIPALMIVIGSFLALTLNIFGHAFYIWITGWTLFISEESKSWGLYMAVEGVLSALNLGLGLTAAVGFVLFANRLKPARE